MIIPGTVAYEAKQWKIAEERLAEATLARMRASRKATEAKEASEKAHKAWVQASQAENDAIQRVEKLEQEESQAAIRWAEAKANVTVED
jgi:hypothetical protein